MTSFELSLASLAALALGALATSQVREAAKVRATASIASAVSLALGLLASVATASGVGSRSASLEGIAAPFVAFTAALVLLALLAAPSTAMRRGWASRVLVTGAALVGFFLAREPVLVWALWTCSAVPAYFELRARSATTSGSLAARAYAAHFVVSSAFVALGLAVGELGPSMHVWSVPLLVLGILARKGALPFHSWVPSFFEEAPLGSAALFFDAHAGGYLLMRLIAADSVAVPTAFLDIVGIATALYGALLATVQPNARRALGYFTLSQSALVFTGLAEGGPVGIGGGVLMILATGLAQAGFTAALWCVEARRGSVRADGHAGGHDRTPGLAGVFLFLGLAGVGLPGTLGFVAEDLVFHSALEHRPWVGVGMVVATALNGINVLRLFLALFGGARRRTGEPDLVRRERFALVGLAVTLVGLGLVPKPVLGTIERALEGTPAETPRVAHGSSSPTGAPAP